MMCVKCGYNGSYGACNCYKKEHFMDYKISTGIDLRYDPYGQLDQNLPYNMQEAMDMIILLRKQLEMARYYYHGGTTAIAEPPKQTLQERLDKLMADFKLAGWIADISPALASDDRKGQQITLMLIGPKNETQEGQKNT